MAEKDQSHVVVVLQSLKIHRIKFKIQRLIFEFQKLILSFKE